MRYIRCKQEQFDIVLAEDGGVIGNAQFGNTVAALDKSGQPYRLPFRGFLPVETHSHLRRVKIIDITQFSFHQRHYCWNDVPPNHYVVGVWTSLGYYLLTHNNSLIWHPLNIQ